MRRGCVACVSYDPIPSVLKIIMKLKFWPLWSLWGSILYFHNLLVAESDLSSAVSWDSCLVEGPLKFHFDLT